MSISISPLMVGACVTAFALAGLLAVKFGREDYDKLHRGEEVSMSTKSSLLHNLFAALVMSGGAVHAVHTGQLDVPLLGVTILLVPVLYRTVHKRVFNARRLTRRT